MDQWNGNRELADSFGRKLADAIYNGTAQPNCTPSEIAKGTVTDFNVHLQPDFAKSLTSLQQTIANPAGSAR